MKTKITPLLIIRNIEEIIATIAVFTMTVICCSNVFARYVLRNAISWADEVEVCLLAWTTFVGAAAGYKRNLHYGMDFIITRIPYKARKTFRIAINVLLLLTCAFLAYHALVFTLSAKKVMPYSKISYKYIDASAIVGFLSMSIYSIIYLVQAFTSKDKYEARYGETGQADDMKEAE